MYLRTLFLLFLVLFSATLSGCHLIGRPEPAWTAGPEVRDVVQNGSEYRFEMSFQFGGDSGPVEMRGVRLVFLSSDREVLNETRLGTMTFGYREYGSFNVTLEQVPYYINMRFDSLQQSSDRGTVVGLQFTGVNEGVHGYRTYSNYTAEY